MTPQANSAVGILEVKVAFEKVNLLCSKDDHQDPDCSFTLHSIFLACAETKVDSVDLCTKLEQSIQGKKHGFLAGNLAYYVGGFHASWQPIEDETIGLTHPFFMTFAVGELDSLKARFQEPKIPV